MSPGTGHPRPVASALAAGSTALLLGACSLLPGGGGPGPSGQDCTVRVENQVSWGLQVTLSAPDGRPPVPFQREIRYMERDDARHLNVPCVYGSALVEGNVRRVSGLSGMQRTHFRAGVCLVPGDTATARLDEYGEWTERWWEDCPPLNEEGDSARTGGAPADTAPDPGRGLPTA